MTMRAAVRTGLLGWTISFTEDQPHPVPQDANASIEPTDILIKVKSAAINPIDYKLPRIAGGKVVGRDVSGVVEKVGAEVTNFQVGDGVFGRASSGSLADYALVGMEEVAQKPEWMPFDQAAALPTAYLTGIQSLRAGHVEKGSSVLIIGASGGCGLAGLQLAKAIGASRIAGICSGKNFEFVREMCGIDKDKDEGFELVDYTDDEAMKNFKQTNAGKFDCIYDTATGSGGEEYTLTMPKLLKEQTGEYVQINGSPSDLARHAMGKMKPQRTMVLTKKKGKADLEEIASLLESSGLKLHIDVKSFDEKGVCDAFEQLKGRRTKGKIVFHIA